MKKINNTIESIKRDFEPLLNFINSKDLEKNWQEYLWNSLGDERCGQGWYIDSNGQKKESNWIWYDFRADVIATQYSKHGNDKNIEFATSKDASNHLKIQLKHVNNQANGEGIFAEYIPDLPKIFGQQATKERVLRLRKRLKEILLRDLQSIEKLRETGSEFIMPPWKNARKLSRRLTLYPDGTVLPDDMGKDAGNLLNFKLYKLLYLICDSIEENEGVNTPYGKLKMRRFRDTLNIIFEKFPGSLDILVKLLICVCGCGQFFLHFGKKQRKFISDKHRLDFHNKLRNESGKQRDYMRSKSKYYDEKYKNT